MIRHNRVHLGALTEHDVARAAGVPWDTWRKNRAVERARFKARVPSLTTDADKEEAYDPEQVRAYFTGTPMPTVVTRDQDLTDQEKHPDDLLTDHEAAAARGIKVKSLWDGIYSGQFTGFVEIAGIRWWPRHTLARKKAGRPAGVPDSAPRVLRHRPARDAVDARVDEIAKQLQEGEAVTVEGVVRRYGVSDRTAQRYIKRAREADRKADV
ncbi:hypothetical protein ABZ569_33310 [Streptomyces albus]|uniref:hypothetical protein n=1 Tax=Streptomyces albus TaxID=1888 RepID=UPI0033E2D47C